MALTQIRNHMTEPGSPAIPMPPDCIPKLARRLAFPAENANTKRFGVRVCGWAGGRASVGVGVGALLLFVAVRSRTTATRLLCAPATAWLVKVRNQSRRAPEPHAAVRSPPASPPMVVAAPSHVAPCTCLTMCVMSWARSSGGLYTSPGQHARKQHSIARNLNLGGGIQRVGHRTTKAAYTPPHPTAPGVVTPPPLPSTHLSAPPMASADGAAEQLAPAAYATPQPPAEAASVRAPPAVRGASVKATPGAAPPKRRTPCNCKKSKCLKLCVGGAGVVLGCVAAVAAGGRSLTLYVCGGTSTLLRRYCECFAAGLVCSKECHCCGCNNTHDHDTIREAAITQTLERNPNAFKPKIQSGNAGVRGPCCMWWVVWLLARAVDSFPPSVPRCMRGTPRGATARSPGARRSTASASKPASPAARTASAFRVRTSPTTTRGACVMRLRRLRPRGAPCSVCGVLCAVCCVLCAVCCVLCAQVYFNHVPSHERLVSACVCVCCARPAATSVATPPERAPLRLRLRRQRLPLLRRSPPPAWHRPRPHSRPHGSARRPSAECRRREGSWGPPVP